MAARLKTALGIEAILVPGGGGEFEVRADDTLVYSKRATGAFPNEDELVAQLARS